MSNEMPYEAETARFIQVLTDANFQKRLELWNRIVTEDSDKLRMTIELDDHNQERIVLRMPSKKQRTADIIVERRQELKEKGVSNSDYARHFFNCSPSRIGNIRNGATCPRDYLINAALMQKTPPTVREMNHLLMEAQHPGLFTDTYLVDENRRNYMLICLFDHIESNSAPQDEIHWPQLAWDMMAYLRLESLPGDGGDPNRLTNEERALIDGWWDQALRNTKPANYLARRNKYRERHTGTLKELAANCGISYQSCHDLFKREPKGHHSSCGTQNSIIGLGIGLKCTLEETNAMLREANLPLVYPPLEAFSIDVSLLQLLQNSADRNE